MKVVIVTSVELGWDCIVAVFKEGDYTQADLEKVFPRKNGYVIFHRDINRLDEFQDEEEDDEGS